jgi:hypothetical protein
VTRRKVLLIFCFCFCRSRSGRHGGWHWRRSGESQVLGEAARWQARTIRKHALSAGRRARIPPPAKGGSGGARELTGNRFWGREAGQVYLRQARAMQSQPRLALACSDCRLGADDVRQLPSMAHGANLGATAAMPAHHP